MVHLASDDVLLRTMEYSPEGKAEDKIHYYYGPNIAKIRVRARMAKAGQGPVRRKIHNCAGRKLFSCVEAILCRTVRMFVFLDAPPHLYKRVCPSVRRSETPSLKRVLVEWLKLVQSGFCRRRRTFVWWRNCRACRDHRQSNSTSPSSKPSTGRATRSDESSCSPTYYMHAR